MHVKIIGGLPTHARAPINSNCQSEQLLKLPIRSRFGLLRVQLQGHKMKARLPTVRAAKNTEALQSSPEKYQLCSTSLTCANRLTFQRVGVVISISSTPSKPLTEAVCRLADGADVRGCGTKPIARSDRSRLRSSNELKLPDFVSKH